MNRLKDDLKFAWDEFSYYIKNNSSFIAISILVIFAAIAINGFAILRYNNQMHIADTKNAKMKSYNNYNKQFSILAEQVNKNTNGTINVVYDVYNMKPYTNTDMIATRVNDLVTKTKLKYNDGNHNKVAAVAVRIYNRKLVFNYGLTPNALYEYTLSIDDKNFNNTSTSDNTYARAWQASNTQKGKINYKNYNLTRQGNLNTNKKDPLSDQEFAFWLKIKMYQTYLDASSLGTSVKAYLNWDLGVTADYNSISETIKKFNEFDGRISNTEGTTNYFPNKLLLRNAMVSYRPQLAYFLATGKVINSYTKAQKALINLNSSKYKSTITKHLETAAKKHNGDVLYDDPFKPLVKPSETNIHKAAKLPFEPVLSENNKWFALYPETNYDSNSGGTANADPYKDVKKADKNN